MPSQLVLLESEDEVFALLLVLNAPCLAYFVFLSCKGIDGRRVSALQDLPALPVPVECLPAGLLPLCSKQPFRDLLWTKGSSGKHRGKEDSPFLGELA